MGGSAIRLPALAQGSLTISGLVLDQAGAPSGEIPVALVARSTVMHSPVVAVSRIDGSFQFGDLPDGDYELRVEPTAHHFAAMTAVRAGVTSAVLVLKRKDAARAVRVHGIVVTRAHSPLATVDVLPIGDKGRAQTDAAGRYELELSLEPGKVPSLRFHKDGYRPQRISLAVSPGMQSQTIKADIVMEAIGDEGRVSGTVSAVGGGPIAGATVQLSSAQRGRSLRAGSDLAGGFVFPKVETASDYRLWVRPPSGYGDHVRDSLVITGAGLELNVVLEPVRKGSLEARLLDPDGKPLPGFSLRLRSAAEAGPIRVVGDAQGRFVVDDLPAGRLSLDTGSAPHLSVSGIEVSPAARQTVDITLDWGDHEITGQVRSADAQPLPGSEVTLHWRRQGQDGISSQSNRRTITDQRGFFRFTRLGSGAHALSVVASGYHSAQREVDVARSGTNEVRVQLQRAVR